ncbi:hypothetical protein HYV86_02245 [Candidatus Woesearchaeota archaeon]|nr:hypothetical protein [Candidatus Woesearchaeota archaeon]
MGNDEYEVIPHQILEDLKFEVEALKKKLAQPDSKINELILEIESLKDSIRDLHTIFTKTLDEVKEEGDIGKIVPAIKEQLDAVASQNETIAKGMIAISDKVDEFISKSSSPQPSSSPTTGPIDMPFSGVGSFGSMPMSRGPSRMAPPMQMDNGFASSPSDLPPPPPRPGAGARRGFGGAFG